MTQFSLTAKPLRLSEADVVGQCRDYLQARGYWLQRNPVGKYTAPSGSTATFGPVGIPDYTAIHGDYPAFFVEFKRPGKKLRPTQVSQFAKIQFGYRLNAVMVDSLEQLIEWLRGHESRHTRGP